MKEDASSRRPFLTPRVVLAFTPEQNMSLGELNSMAATLRQRVKNKYPIIDSINVDQDVNTIVVHLLTVISYDKLEDIKVLSEQVLRQEGVELSSNSIAVQSITERSAL